MNSDLMNMRPVSVVKTTKPGVALQFRGCLNFTYSRVGWVGRGPVPQTEVDGGV